MKLIKLTNVSCKRRNQLSSKNFLSNLNELIHVLLLLKKSLFYFLLLLMFIGTRLLLSTTSSAVGNKMFKNVCLGGTFDGIHAGHKLLFNESTRICSEKLVVGVTDTNMVKNKTLWELIAPVDERIQQVRDYLMTINPNLTYQIVPINDLYGPTITEENLQCIVVSEETVKGANKINEARKEKGWNELEIKTVNLLPDTNSLNKLAMTKLNESKVSSSLMRFNKLGTILKPPEPNDSIPSKPYLIGLTGGIASGKTTIGKYLQSLGFGYINYDLLGHKTYSSPNLPIYKQIVEYFGNSIVDETTKQIDRAKLGKIVFEDKTMLKKLNELVWPGIYKLVDEEIEQLKSNHDVIVLESALLVESGQKSRVHQVWTTIVAPEEAIRRQMESRGLTREEADKRIHSQTDNLTRVRQSNAVFCTSWEIETTQQQVQKCVRELREKYLNN